MSAKLRIVKGRRAGEVYQLNFGETLVVGRDETCNICVVEESISRRHFSVEGKGRSFVLSDLGSANGVMVNGKPVQTKVLRDHDRIRAGGVEMEFRIASEAEEGASSLAFPAESAEPAIKRRYDDTEIGKDLPQKTAGHLKRLRDMLGTLYAVGRAINAETDRDRIFQAILDSVVSCLRADRGFLILYDPETDLLDPVVVRGEEAGSQLSLSRSILTECVKKGVSILSMDTLQDERFKAGASIILHNIRSAMCVPMESKDRILGALYVDNLNVPGAFSEFELEMLTAIGKQAGSAIERLKLKEDLERLFYGTIRTLVATIEAKDHYTKGHTERVTTYTLQIAEEMGLSSSDLDFLQMASLLHDVGKIGIPEKILKKPGKLTPGEYEIMKRHPAIGAEIVSNIDNIEKVREVVLSHHEKWDGTGYPRGLKGEDAPLGARILAVADAYDAMTSTRSYRRNFSEEEVIKEFKRCAGFQFDREVVKGFFQAYRKGRIIPPDILGVDQVLPKDQI